MIYLLQYLLFFFALICSASSEQWKALPVEKLMILDVAIENRDEVFAAAIDKANGPVLLHSRDEGNTWDQTPVFGSNRAIAISNDKTLLCGAGSKVYCLDLIDHNKKLEAFELPFKGLMHDIQPLLQKGFAIVGIFPDLSDEKLLHNGLLVNPDLDQQYWKFIDIGLDHREGYYVQSGAFPSNDTWYVVSGYWPEEESPLRNMLSGRLNIVTGSGVGDLLNYHYEFSSLNLVKPMNYAGAISKTTDGGRTWKKVFDSNKKFYFNNIHCYDDNHCLAIGEGSFDTYIVKTSNGGDSWEVLLRVASEYSLRGAFMISPTEMWVTGGMKMVENNEDHYLGVYYHSIDGGSTWDLQTGEGYAFDVAFAESSHGFSTSIFPTHCQINKYT